MRAVFPGNTRCIAKKTVPRRGKAPLFGCFGSFQICPSMDSGEEMILELISKVAFSSGVWYFMDETSHSFLILCLSTQRSERIVYLRWFHWRLRRQSLLLEEKVPQCALGRMWCAVHSYDYRNTSAKTYCRNTTSVSLRATASPQGEAFGACPAQVEPSHMLR